jgi:ring-1,2-phenylacetyl-CoA epoxidase subunit PaaD
MVMPVAPAPAVCADSILAALADVADPEIPAISIVDLGIVHRAEVAADGRVMVELLPTFLGCPAI